MNNVRSCIRVAFLVMITVGAGETTAAQENASPDASSDASFEIARDPSFLLGTWHVTEQIYPGTDREYTERSVRMCSYVLMNTYVLCEAMGSGRTQKREGWFLVNQPDGAGTIEFLTAVSNVPNKGVYRGRFLEDGTGIDLRNYEISGAELVPGTFQRLRFRSPDEFEWWIGIRNPGTPEETVMGIEKAVRVSMKTSRE